MNQTMNISGLRIPFVKAGGCGNTFLIIEAANDSGRAAELTKRMCDPHTGIGADGVEWVAASTSDDADVDARLINADGSEAEISGNGTRCVAAYWLSQNGGTSNSVRVRTGAGVKHCVLTSRADSNLEFHFEMNMGEPMSYLVKKDFPPGDCSNFARTNSLTSSFCYSSSLRPLFSLR